jgi:hypothetical protein
VAQKFKGLIEDYCKRHRITVPVGFGRNSPSRYAIVLTNQRPPKLVAMTWFKTADVLTYIDMFLVPEFGEECLSGVIRILDFKTSELLERAPSGKRLVRAGKFK